jgi:hypothetical protein
MSDGAGLAVALAILAAVLGLFQALLVLRFTRRFDRDADERRRLAQLEGKVAILDVAGTQGTQAALAVLRRDIEALETLHRADLATVDGRIGSLSLSMAQLAERLNGFEWIAGARGRNARGPAPAPPAH